MSITHHPAMLRPRRVHLLPPVSYQGGKRRQAPEIVRHMALDPEQEFWELCAGSGAVSLELISRGHNPSKITMVDAGPWGDVWRLVGAGEFDLRTLEIVGASLLASAKHDPAIPLHLTQLREEIGPTHPLAPYAFLFLQSGAFGCKAVTGRGDKWAPMSWSPPGDTQHPPLIPEPHVIIRRMKLICQRARGLRGISGDVRDVFPQRGAVVYVDPPYIGSAGYGHDVDVHRLAEQWAGSPVFASERVPLTQNARSVRARKTSGISGKSTADASEYLSLFNADWPTPDYERAEQGSLF